MREIKFRAWSEENKLFYYDAAIENGEVVLLDYDFSFNGWHGVKAVTIDDTIIEQYTGLKDKNGKEIYEGDILREKGLLSLTCVEWDKNNARYITEVLDKSKHVSSTFYFDIFTALECEVIGNIHENPELLEQEDAKN